MKQIMRHYVVFGVLYFNVKVTTQLFAYRVSPRGVDTIKKNDLVAKFCPLMPSNRKRFWMNMPVNDMSGDLIDQQAVVEV